MRAKRERERERERGKVRYSLTSAYVGTLSVRACAAALKEYVDAHALRSRARRLNDRRRAYRRRLGVDALVRCVVRVRRDRHHTPGRALGCEEEEMCTLARFGHILTFWCVSLSSGTAALSYGGFARKHSTTHGCSLYHQYVSFARPNTHSPRAHLPFRSHSVLVPDDDTARASRDELMKMSKQ